MSDDDDDMPPSLGAVMLALVAWGLVVLVVLFVVHFLSPHPAHAHDAEHPELNSWYQHLRSPGHGRCCDGSDAMHLADPDWDSKDGHYRVRLDGEWVDVPDDAVVTDPNRDGRALVWPYYIDGKLKDIRCFMPGAGA